MTSSSREKFVPHAIVVDADTQWRAAIKSMLRGLHGKVLEAGSPAEAFEQIDANDIDLAIVDIGVPGTGEIGIAALIAAHRPEIAIVVTSVLAEPSDGQLPDCAAFMTKPFDMNELLDAMTTAWARREAKFDLGDIEVD